MPCLKDNKILMITLSCFNVNSFIHNVILTSLLTLLLYVMQEMALSMVYEHMHVFMFMCNPCGRVGCCLIHDLVRAIRFPSLRHFIICLT